MRMPDHTAEIMRQKERIHDLEQEVQTLKQGVDFWTLYSKQLEQKYETLRKQHIKCMEWG